MHVRAYAPSVINGHGMYISRLAADEDGLETRELYRRLNEISDHFSLEPAYVIQQGFSTNDEAFSWLHAHPEARVLIRGDAQWYDALVNKAVHLPELQHQTLPPFFTAAARALGFEDIAEFPVVRVSWLNEPFVLSGAPERIVLPGEPATLTRHFLALLGAGLAERDLEPAGEDEGTARIQERSARKHAFQAAAWIEGQWKNAHGLGAARALAATLSILDAVDMPPVLEERALHCAQVELHTAAGLAPHEEAPEVAAMIYNNIAVARILAGYRDYDFQKAFGWLSTASMMQTSDGSPVLGARLALLNLHMLWRSGLITPEMLRRRALPHEN